MTHKELQVLLLKRMDELDRWHGDDPTDPEKIVDKEHNVVYEVAEKMARAGFPRLYTAGLALLAHRKAKLAKTYLSRCLKALRRDRLARSQGAAADSAMPQLPDEPLTVADVARRLGVSRRVAYELCQDGEIGTFKIGRSIRVKPEDLDAYIDNQSGAGHPDPLACHRRARKPRRL